MLAEKKSLIARPSAGYEFGLVVLLFFTWGTVFLDRMSGLMWSSNVTFSGSLSAAPASDALAISNPALRVTLRKKFDRLISD